LYNLRRRSYFTYSEGVCVDLHQITFLIYRKKCGAYPAAIIKEHKTQLEGASLRILLFKYFIKLWMIIKEKAVAVSKR